MQRTWFFLLSISIDDIVSIWYIIRTQTYTETPHHAVNKIVKNKTQLVISVNNLKKIILQKIICSAQMIKNVDDY